MDLVNNAEAKGEVDLVEWFQWITFDNIVDLSFWESFHCLTETRYHPWVANLIDGLKFVAVSSVAVRFLPLQRVLHMLLTTERLRKARDAQWQLASNQVEKRLNSNITRPDFMAYIEAHNDTKRGMTRQEIKETARTFVGAGSETTAGILCGFISYVLQNPVYLQKVQDEIRKACKTPKDVDLKTVEKLQYFNTLVTETFRLYPTALAGQPRKIPPGGSTVSGWYLAGGTGIQMTQYAAFNSSLNFASSSTFAPERWLDSAKAGYASDTKDVLQPFSVGARGCIGKNLAWRRYCSYWHGCCGSSI